MNVFRSLVSVIFVVTTTSKGLNESAFLIRGNATILKNRPLTKEQNVFYSSCICVQNNKLSLLNSKGLLLALVGSVGKGLGK